MSDFLNLCVPLVNANGSGIERLVNGYNNAFIDLDIAYGRLKATGPNARDYPDTDSFEMANEQHLERLQKIADVMDELDSLMERINQQKPGV